MLRLAVAIRRGLLLSIHVDRLGRAPLMRRPLVIAILAWMASHAAGVVAAAPAANAATTKAPVILPLADVRPGMVGYALTVFQGTQPERFQVRVVSILRKFLPNQDVILIRAEDPRVTATGIAAGMSGSPVYIEGKLMGAIAYGWNFAKEPIAGVTPIEAMLAENQRPRRGAARLAAKTAGDAPGGIVVAEGGDARANDLADAEDGPSNKGLSSRASASRMPNPSASLDSGLRPVTLALAFSGMPAKVVSSFASDFEAMGITAVQGGGGRAKTSPGPGRVEPGSAIGVELIRGDMSAVGTGTVTYVKDNAVLAFGHPMMGVGEVYLPLVDAEIHAILPSLSQSMKLSSPRHEVGSLVQDRQACIVGDLSLRSSMVPMVVRVRTPEAAPRTFTTEIARNRRLTPTLAFLVAAAAASDADSTATDVTLTMTSRISLRGQASPLTFREQTFSSEGVSKVVLASTRGLRAIADLLFNPFEPVVVERIDLDLDVEFRHDFAEVVGVTSPGGTIRPGDTIALRVQVRPYAGAERTEVIPVRIPTTAARQVLRMEIVAGSQARPEMAPPEGLRGYLENIQKAYPPQSWVVNIARPDDGVALRGRLLPSLPGAALDTLKPASQTRRGDGYRISERVVFPTSYLTLGKQDVSVWVDDEAPSRNE